MVRKAKAEDCNAIAKISVQGWQNTYRNIIDDGYLKKLNVAEKEKKYKEEILEEGIEYLVYEENNHIVGFVKYGAIRDKMPPYDSEVYAIYVLQEEQRKKVGSQLFEKAQENLRKQDYHRMMTWCLEENHIGKQFYEAKEGKSIVKRKVSIGGKNYIEEAYGYEL